MRHCTKAAPGHTLHGLRKTLGKALAEQSTTRQLMGVLGHDNAEPAELYSREPEQVRCRHGKSDELAPSEGWRTCLANSPASF